MTLRPLDTTEPTEYLVGHVEEALACDSRVNEQGLHVRIVAGRVFVTGTVSTQARWDAVAEVIGELLPGWEACNDAVVTDFPEPAGMEAIG